VSTENAAANIQLSQQVMHHMYANPSISWELGKDPTLYAEEMAWPVRHSAVRFERDALSLEGG
jgi:hypothetical protein